MLEVGVNSYLSVEDASIYFGGRLYADNWAGASDEDKAKALMMATARINALHLKGRKADASQKLAFPRCYSDFYWLRDHDPNASYVGGWYCESEPPQEVLDAVCEEALALLDPVNEKRGNLQDAGVVSFSLGSLSETFGSKARGNISASARGLLRLYLAGAVPIR